MSNNRGDFNPPRINFYSPDLAINIRFFSKLNTPSGQIWTIWTGQIFKPKMRCWTQNLYSVFDVACKGMISKSLSNPLILISFLNNTPDRLKGSRNC